jgi:type II secretory ATPase GspE/PulE/Tfp pilus assembly ATPase PilB-like protein
VSAELVSSLQLTERFEADYLEYNGILPLSFQNDRLRVAVTGEPAVEVLDDLELGYGCSLDIVPVTSEELIQGIHRAFAAVESVVELTQDLSEGYGYGGEASIPLVSDVRDLARQAPVVRFVNLLIHEAYQARASDIHLESRRDGMRVRFRIDGVLQEEVHPPKAIQAAVVSRVKLLAGLDIAERRAPQDGRIRARLDARELDLRVSTVPTLHGESIVLRLLERGGQPVALDELGMEHTTLCEFKRLAERPHGIVLATGPTGSGKTTTLYAALGLRRTSAEKLITVEDPVEYHLEGVSQVPVSTKAGMTFGSALRAILRQDPDVLMVGEMRDSETAHIAVQAAMTGHLVFSTLHTNGAVGAIPRLVDLAVPPFMIAAAVEGILAQRLVRKVCPDCRECYRPDPESAGVAAGRPVGAVNLERGRGCPSCRDTGYRGRTGIFELVKVTEELKDAIACGADRSLLWDIAVSSGTTRISQDGWRKACAGTTTVEEVLRVTQA